MFKSLEYMNYLLNCNGNLDYTLNGKKVFYISEDILELFKKDLEALEIVLKKNVDIKFLKFNIEGFIEGAYETIEVSLWAYNLRQKDDEKLTMEELLKLKQWLESNKVGDNHD